MGFRPNLPDSLNKIISEEDDTGAELYKRMGYTSKSAFVAQAVKEKIQREREKMED